MTENRLEFYDPLYETITFEKGLPSSRQFLSNSGEDPLDPRDIIETAEFARLAHLRQTGLGWLVFPSATHTRFAHSIGCWWLGRMSETLIRVKGKVKGIDCMRTLHSWLKDTKLREEFYLGLLFHDIGHAPLSHVLERNPEFGEGLREAKIAHVDHEHRGAELFDANSPLAQKWKQIAKQKYGNDIKTLVDIRHIFDERLETVCVPGILYLITGDRTYLSNCPHDHKAFLGILHELVSGLLDIDRLDHYARDSYFSGLKQGVINVRGFLNNLCLTYGDNMDNPHLSLSEGGVSAAATLLFGKRQITATMLRNHRVLAFESMINWALSAHLQGLGKAKADACLTIALMEDAEFFETIANSMHAGCRHMCQRIRAVQPYHYVGRWPNDEVGVNQSKLRLELDDYVNSSNKDGMPTVIIRFDDGFWGRPEASRDWLDTGRLLVEDGGRGQFLTVHLEHKDNFVFLRDAGRVKFLWVFVLNDADKARVGREVSNLLGFTGFGADI
jgi:HD superfamily phosphohydrolase